MMTSLNWVDDIILVLFLISILVGLMRGLVKEMIGLITWAAAFVVAILFSPALANFFNSYETPTDHAAAAPSALSMGTSFIILFIATIIVGTLINYFVSRAVEMGGISFTNRLLGAVFGLARGFLLVIFAIFLVQLTPIGEKTYWATSQFVNSFQPPVKWINDKLGSDIQNLKTKVGDTIKNVEIQHANDSEKAVESQTNKPTN